MNDNTGLWVVIMIAVACFMAGLMLEKHDEAVTYRTCISHHGLKACGRAP